MLASESPTVFTNLLTGGLARGFAGRLVRELGPVRPEAPPYPLAAVALSPIRAAAEKKGEYGFGPLWAGQSASLGEAISELRAMHELDTSGLAFGFVLAADAAWLRTRDRRRRQLRPRRTA